MSSHTTVFLPIQAWTYSSPELRDSGKTIDIGLLAECLLYYEQVVIEMTEGSQLGDFVTSFDQQGRLPDLLAMMQDRTITFSGYNYILTNFKSRSGEHVTAGVTKMLTLDAQNNQSSFALNYTRSDALASHIKDHYLLSNFRSLLRDTLHSM